MKDSNTIAPAVVKTNGDKGNLNQHIRKKKLGMNYTCELCQQVFNFKERLKQHIDIKHKVFTEGCENC